MEAEEFQRDLTVLSGNDENVQPTDVVHASSAMDAEKKFIYIYSITTHLKQLNAAGGNGVTHGKV